MCAYIHMYYIFEIFGMVNVHRVDKNEDGRITEEEVKEVS